MQRDHRQALKAGDLKLSFSYFVEDFEQLIVEVIKGIESICPDYMTLCNLWHIKDNSYFGANQLVDESERGQSYERDDAFNVVGLGVYLLDCSLLLKFTASRRVGVLQKSFELEMFLPFVRHLIENESTSLNHLGRFWLKDLTRETAGHEGVYSPFLSRYFQDLDHACKRTPAALLTLTGRDTPESLQKLDLRIIWNYFSLYGAKG